jgi:GH24 family phage-related lysozyme (muramidase)
LERDIIDSVGDAKKGAVNREDDVRTVQGLLNVQIVTDRRSDRFISVDGRIDSEILSAIVEFQRRSGLAQSGLIRRGDATIQALTPFSGPRGMRVSGNLVDWLKNQPNEGFGATPYPDAHKPIPNATIGWGHKLHRGPVTDADRKKWGPNGISRAQADEIFRGDLSKAENAVNSDVRVPLGQNQFDALVSLTFNIGSDAFRRSTLVRFLNTGDYLGAAQHFEDFHNAHHQPVPGLPARRREEKEFFLRR